MNLEKENELIPMKTNIRDFLKRIEKKPFKNPKGSNLIEKSLILLLLNEIDNCLFNNNGSIIFNDNLIKKCIKEYNKIDNLQKNYIRLRNIFNKEYKEIEIQQKNKNFFDNNYSSNYELDLNNQKKLLLQKNFNKNSKKILKLKENIEKYPNVNKIIIQLLAWERNKIYDIINSIDSKNKKIYLKNNSNYKPKIYEYSLSDFSDIIKKGIFGKEYFLPNGKLTEYYYTGVGLYENI